MNPYKSLSELTLNIDNPRLITEERFAHLVQSLIDFPEMLRLRPAVVDEAGLVLGGNMRTRAKQFLLDLPEAEATARLEQAVGRRQAEREQSGDTYDETKHRELLRWLFFTDEVPATVAEGLTEAQKREFIIKDNATFGEWNWEDLANGRFGDTPQLIGWGVELPKKWGEDAADVLPEKELKEPLATEHTCPNCGHEF